MHHLGLTRSSTRRDHMLLTPDTFIRTPLPGLKDGMAIVHVSPQAGAGFTMTTVEFEPGGILAEGPTQRFAYVLEGEVRLSEPDSHSPHDLAVGSYAYLPTDFPHTFRAESKSRVVLIEKPFYRLSEDHSKAIAANGGADAPWFLVGHESEVASTALDGDPALQVRSLLPAEFAFDFACNTMTYQPGASLSQVEIHYMEHGLLMLEGGGIYRLGDQWYPTQAGDFIWMSAYCPQWFGAIGKQPAKYLIYKDFNRHTLG
ncbi:MAG TPA: (S)-ureidoglycine aminohydrolase [Acidobacteriaceae bacterium]|jgi:(S)-ureidoglycine aminohydrolase